MFVSVFVLVLWHCVWALCLGLCLCLCFGLCSLFFVLCFCVWALCLVRHGQARNQHIRCNAVNENVRVLQKREQTESWCWWWVRSLQCIRRGTKLRFYIPGVVSSVEARHSMAIARKRPNGPSQLPTACDDGDSDGNDDGGADAGRSRRVPAMSRCGYESPSSTAHKYT